jgi:hypothetical protein
VLNDEVFVLNYVVEFLSQYPQFNLFLATVGGLRLVMKPLFSALHLIVAQPPSPMTIFLTA